MRRVIFYFILFLKKKKFSERAARGGGGGGALPDFFFFFFFPCSADHKRDWPPCKVVFFRVGNQCAECEKQQQQHTYIHTGGTSNASQATAGGTSSGRSSLTTSTGGTSNAPQLTAGGASSGRKRAVSPRLPGRKRTTSSTRASRAPLSVLRSVEYHETGFVPGFGRLVLDALLDNYNVPRHDFYGLTGANAFTNG